MSSWMVSAYGHTAGNVPVPVPLTEVKPCQALSVLRWVTTWEPWVLYAFFTLLLSPLSKKMLISPSLRSAHPILLMDLNLLSFIAVSFHFYTWSFMVVRWLWGKNADRTPSYILHPDISVMHVRILAVIFLIPLLFYLILHLHTPIPASSHADHGRPAIVT